LDAFARCFDDQSVDLLVAKIKSSELDAYATLDKFVAWLVGNGAAPKTIWIYVGAVKSLLEHEEILLDRRKLRRVQLPAKVEVYRRRFSHPYPQQDELFYLCEKCYNKRTTESSGESKDADEIAEPASKGDIRAILQTAALQIKVLGTFPLDQRIAKLEELLANKPQVAPGMEPAYEAYEGVLQKELDNAKAARDHAAQTSNG
jgi:hypothetical protein